MVYNRSYYYSFFPALYVYVTPHNNDSEETMRLLGKVKVLSSTGLGQHHRRNILTYSTLFSLRNMICRWKHGYGCHEFVRKKPFVRVDIRDYVKA